MARRIRSKRWIASLRPYVDLIHRRASTLRLGAPDKVVGPSLIGVRHQYVHTAIIWHLMHVGGVEVGINVDFFPDGVLFNAWFGSERHAEIWVSGKISEKSLDKDLSLALAAAGISDFAFTADVRAALLNPETK
jgi:hypothetical protein